MGCSLAAVRKCQLCNHRYKEGKYSACAESCPTGATIFGKVTELRNEAKRRLGLKPGTMYDFPLQTCIGSDSRRAGRSRNMRMASMG